MHSLKCGMKQSKKKEKSILSNKNKSLDSDNSSMDCVEEYWNLAMVVVW